MSKQTPNRVILECTVFHHLAYGPCIIIRRGGLALLYGGYGMDMHRFGDRIDIQLPEDCPAFGLRIPNKYGMDDRIVLRRAVDLTEIAGDGDGEHLLDEPLHGVVSGPDGELLRSDQDILEAGTVETGPSPAASGSNSSPQTPAPAGQPRSARPQPSQPTRPTSRTQRHNQTSGAPAPGVPAGLTVEALMIDVASSRFRATTGVPLGCTAGTCPVMGRASAGVCSSETQAAAGPAEGSAGGGLSGWIVKHLPWRGLRSRVFRCIKCTPAKSSSQSGTKQAKEASAA